MARYVDETFESRCLQCEPERFESTGTEQKKPRFLFFGERNKEQKKSRFMQKRSRDDDSSSYATRSFIDRSNIDGLIGDRSERDITERVIGREFEGAGDPSPVIIRESTQSEGDIRALLKAPL